MSKATLNRWQATYGAMKVSEAKELKRLWDKRLREESSELKRYWVDQA
ncbi:MAG: hypothetical protein SPF30_02040 [Arcanobacterium sp.]|nr:hypothetical protein [Arcanobacterium sp.]